MTLLEATLMLLTKGVPRSMFSIEALGHGENVGIMRNGGKWDVFFNERGYADSVETFDDEEQAVARFLVLLDAHLRDYGNEGILEPPAS